MIEGTVELDFLAADMSRGIRSGDLDFVLSLMSTVGDEEIYYAYSKVMHEISIDINTKHLDNCMKNVLKSRRQVLIDAISETRAFRYSLMKIRQMPSGYPKYQATMVAYGHDPLPFAEWQKTQENLDQRSVS